MSDSPTLIVSPPAAKPGVLADVPLRDAAADTARYIAPLGAFAGRSPDEAKRGANELSNAKRIVRILRGKSAVVLKTIEKTLLHKLLTRLEQLVDDPSATHMDVCYCAEAINRLLDTCGRIAVSFGVDDLASAAAQAVQAGRANKRAAAALRKADEERLKKQRESAELAEKLRESLGMRRGQP